MDTKQNAQHVDHNMDQSEKHYDAATQLNVRRAKTYKDIPPDQHLVPYGNIGRLLEMHADDKPGETYLIHYDGDGNRHELTYGDFNAQVNRAANLLRSLGIRRGDRVATIAYNHADTVILYFACWRIGALVAPQNITEDDNRIAFILRNSESVIVFVRAEYIERAERIIHGSDEGLGAPNIRQIIEIGGTPCEEYLHFQTEMAKQSAEFTADGEVGLETESLLVYTSGTTGAPKGVVLTQYNMLADSRAIAEWHGLTDESRLMCVLPIHHVNGIIVTLITPMFVGCCTVLNRQFSTSTFWQRIVRERVHIVSTVPTLLQFLCDYAEAHPDAPYGEGIARADLSAFRYPICGAGTLSLALVKRFEDQFGIPILHGYGLSETTCYSCYLPIDQNAETHRHWMHDFGYPSIGCPIGVNEMAIFDAAGEGRQLGAGERGEICVRGHNVMKYYYLRPESNREAFKFGWFRTGDEGFMQTDEQGRHFFFITGRIKELINRGGVKFSPFDIEEVLLTLPGVKVGLAIAFENDYYGEEVGAYVVLNDNATLTEADVLAHCRTRMGFEKSPKVVVFGTEIPVTTTGKYQRLKLRDQFAEWKSTQFKK
jgi:acyl-CoA synthetase (AMP-forming)/AMP-acid ligase II